MCQEGPTVSGLPAAGSSPLPPGDRERFSDPAAEPVYSLDPASLHPLLDFLRTKLLAQTVADNALRQTEEATEGSWSTLCGSIATTQSAPRSSMRAARRDRLRP